VYKKRGSLLGSFGRLSWKKNHLGHWAFDNAACRTNVDYAEIAIGLRKNGVCSSLMTTMSPTRRFYVGTCLLLLLWSSLRYSSFHRVRNCWWGDFKCCHRFRMDLDSPFTSGCRRGPPTRKCHVVNAMRSDGSSDIGDSGLEFRQASILARRVDSSSKVYFGVAVDL